MDLPALFNRRTHAEWVSPEIASDTPSQCLQNDSQRPLDRASLPPPDIQRSDSHGCGIGGVPTQLVGCDHPGPFLRGLDDFRGALLLYYLHDPTRPPCAVLRTGFCAITLLAVRPSSRQRHPAAREPYSSMVAHACHILRTTLQTSRPCQHLARH